MTTTNKKSFEKISREDIEKKNTELKKALELLPKDLSDEDKKAVERIEANGQTVFNEMLLQLNLPGSGEKLHENVAKLKELIHEAIQLRFAIHNREMKRITGVDAKRGLAEDFVERVDAALPSGKDSKVTEKLAKRMKQIADSLDFIPERTSTDVKKAPGAKRSIFWRWNDIGGISMNQQEVAQARKDIGEVLSGGLVPADKQKVFADMLASLDQLEATASRTDPYYMFGKAMSGIDRNTDWSRVRFLGAIFCVAMVIVGLINWAKSGKLSPATLLWAGILGLTLFPKTILGNFGFQAQERLKFLGDKEILDMLNNPKYKDRMLPAVEEFYALKGQPAKKNIDAFLKTGLPNMNAAQLSELQLSGGELEKLLTAMNETERVVFLKRFSTITDKQTQSAVVTAVKVKKDAGPLPTARV